MIKEDNLIKIGYHINSDIDIYVENKMEDKVYNGRVIGRKLKSNYSLGEEVVYKTGDRFYTSLLQEDNKGNLYFKHRNKKILNNEIFR
jgi:hypothetical protein